MRHIDRMLSLHVRKDGAIVVTVYRAALSPYESGMIPISRGVFSLGWQYLVGPKAGKQSLISRAIMDWETLESRITVTFET